MVLSLWVRLRAEATGQSQRKKPPMTPLTNTTTKNLRLRKVSVNFLAHYLNLSADEIPMVLLELNESALIYIQ